MKKILFIVPEFPSVSQTFILNQITSLIDLGCDITIYSLGKPCEEIVHEKIKHYKLLDKVIYPCFENRFSNLLKNIFSSNLKHILKSLKISKYGKDAYRLTNFCKIQPFFNKQNNFDVIHIHFGQMLENYLLLKDVGLLKTDKVILTFHGYDLEPKDILVNRERYKAIVHNNIHVTLNTPYLEGIFNKSLPYYTNYSILPVGLDTLQFNPKKNNSDDKEINIVFCGRFIVLKGVRRLPDIIKSVVVSNNNHKIVRFHIIGDGDINLVEEFKTKIKEYKISENVEYYGSQSQEEIIKIYNKSDIFIMPGIYDRGRAETQGLVIQEAQAMELPVVVTDAGGMRYGMVNNKTGFVVDHTSDDEFINKINELIKNSEMRKKFGIEARKYVVENFDNKYLASELLKIYNR